MDMGSGDQRRLAEVKRIMQGNAKPPKHHADATHLYDAALWQAAYFVTCDRRIHAKQNELMGANLGLWIVGPSQLLVIYEQHC